MSITYTFYVPGIRCVNCYAPIEKTLKACSELGIQSLEIDDKEISIKLSSSIDPFFLQKKITELLKPIGHTPIFSDELFQEQTQEQIRNHWFQGILGTVSGFILLMVCMFSGPMSLTLMASLAISSGLLTGILGASSYRLAFLEWKQLLQGNYQLTMDSLFAVSTIVVLLVSIAAFFVPWLPMMLETGLLIFGFRHFGLAIEGSLTRMMQLKTKFVDRLPTVVRVKTEKGIVEQPLASVQPGQIIMIHPGEIIPLDGQCLSTSQPLIYDGIITGAYLPHEVKPDELLLSGLKLADGGGVLELKVTESLETSHLKRRDQRISQTKFENKADYEIFAKQLLNYFIPIVLFLSIVSACVLACFFPWAIALRSAIGVLVSACPCTLGLVVPLAIKIGMQKAADQGVLFRSKEQLQRAGEVNCVVFDLNGTLTIGNPCILGEPVIEKSSISKKEFLQAIACLEKTSTHPHGRALYEYVKDMNLEPSDISVQRHHFGMVASMNGHQYSIGNQKMMASKQIDVEMYSKRKAISLKSGEHIVYLARDQQIVGHIILSDPLRPEAKWLVDSIKALGKEVYICTGADKKIAKHYAKQLEISVENIRASQRCSLQKEDNEDDKSTFIKSLRNKGLRVAMVGDAGNDALAIAASDFGLALRSKGGDSVTQAEAGAVIYGSSLLPVISAFSVAKQTVSHIKQNLMLSLGYNVITECLVGGLLAISGVMLNPSVGVVLMIIQMCLILGNAYWFKQASPISGVPLKGEKTPENEAEQHGHGLGLHGPTHNQCRDSQPPVQTKSLWENRNGANDVQLSTRLQHF